MRYNRGVNITTTLRNWLPILLVAGVAGALFAWLRVPAAWMLGPMVGVGLLVTFVPRQRALPGWIYLVAQATVGGAMSAAITPASLTVLLESWFPILLVIVLLNAFSVSIGMLLARLTELDLPTAILGTQPGGAPGMVAISESLGADVRLVVLMQTVRIMLVLASLALVAWLVVPSGTAVVGRVATVPNPLAMLSTALIIGVGSMFGVLLRLPAGVMIGPALLGMLVGLAGLPHPAPPDLLLLLAYAVIGVQIGLTFDLPAIQAAGRIMLPFVLSTLLLIVTVAIGGAVLAWDTGDDLFSGYLATAPGGLSLVTIIALESDANVALVLTLSLLRFISILLISPLVLRWLVRYAAAHAPDAPAPR